MTETTMTDAVHDLINDWTDAQRTGSGIKAIDHPPLLVTLQNAIRSSVGGTTSGASDPAERVPLNVEAFELQASIARDVAHLTRAHTKDRPNSLLGFAVRTLAGKLDALWATNQIAEHDYQAAIRRAQSWRERIWAMLHKPREKELAFCPACEEAKVTNGEGDTQAALVAYYSDDTEPFASCRNCAREWVGEAQLIALGVLIGATPDQETLTAMGVRS